MTPRPPPGNRLLAPDDETAAAGAHDPHSGKSRSSERKMSRFKWERLYCDGATSSNTPPHTRIPYSHSIVDQCSTMTFKGENVNVYLTCATRAP